MCSAVLCCAVLWLNLALDSTVDHLRAKTLRQDKPRAGNARQQERKIQSSANQYRGPREIFIPGSVNKGKVPPLS